MHSTFFKIVPCSIRSLTRVVCLGAAAIRQAIAKSLVAFYQKCDS